MGSKQPETQRRAAKGKALHVVLQVKTAQKQSANHLHKFTGSPSMVVCSQTANNQWTSSKTWTLTTKRPWKKPKTPKWRKVWNKINFFEDFKRVARNTKLKVVKIWLSLRRNGEAFVINTKLSRTTTRLLGEDRNDLNFSNKWISSLHVVTKWVLHLFQK